MNIRHGNSFLAAAPDEFKVIMKRAEERDRAYFKQHPMAEQYTRSYMKGEIWPLHRKKNSLVIVTIDDQGIINRAFPGSPQGVMAYPGYEEEAKRLYFDAQTRSASGSSITR